MSDRRNRESVTPVVALSAVLVLGILGLVALLRCPPQDIPTVIQALAACIRIWV